MAGFKRDRGRDEVTITPYRDGPLLVRGPVRLLTPDGAEIPHSSATIALCRCGKSRTRPFCDGTHKLTGFRASDPIGRPQGRPDEPAAEPPAYL